MKAWHLLVIAGVGVGVWWWWRRSGGAIPSFLAPPPPPVGYTPAPIPSATPGTVGGGWAETAGNVASVGAAGYCVSQGGDPRACQLAGQVTGWVTEKAAPKVVSGTKWVAGKVGDGAKKTWDVITFWN